MRKQPPKPEEKKKEVSAVDKSVELLLENFRENLYHVTYGQQGKVAEAAGLCARQHLHDIMTGKYVPTMRTALMIAAATGMPLSDLLLPPEVLDVKYPKVGARKKARKILQEAC